MLRTFLTRDMVLILGSSFFYLASPMLVNPLIAGFTGTLGGSVAVMGLIGGLMNLCSLFVRPIAGNLADRFCKRWLAMAGAGLMAASCLGYVFVTDTWQLAVLRVGNGIGYSLCSVCMSTWLSGMLPANRMGSGMGYFGMMNALGMAVGPSVGLAVEGVLGYRAALGCAGLFAALAVGGAALVRDSGEPTAGGRARVARGGRTSVLDTRVVPVALIVMLFTIPYTATQAFVVSYAEACEAGDSVALFFPVYAVALLTLRFVLRRQFDTVRFGPFLAAASLSSAASLGLLAVMHGAPTIVLAAVFMAGGYGVMCSVCQSTAVKLVERERLGLANSTYYMGFDLGMTLGPVIGGILFGSLPIAWFYPALMLSIPVALAVFACWHRS